MATESINKPEEILGWLVSRRQPSEDREFIPSISKRTYSSRGDIVYLRLSAQDERRRLWDMENLKCLR
jgi:hypothetical protein